MHKYQISYVQGVIVLITVFLNVRATAQELSYKQYSAKDGLPSATVYHTLQDNTGFIWFATSQGVSRFDGRTIKNYSKEDGLPDDEVVKLYLDQYNHVWFISFLGIPSVFYNDSIIQFDHCQGVKAIIEDWQTDSIIFVGEIETKNKKAYGLYTSANKPGHWNFIKKFRTDPHDWPVLRASSREKINFYFSGARQKKPTLLIKSLTRTSRHALTMYGDRPFTPQSFFCLSPDKKAIVFQTIDSIYYADADKLYPILAPDDLHTKELLSFIFYENDTTLWLCTRNRGLLCVKNFLTPRKTIHSFFNKSFCTSIIKDYENGYWVTTHDDGVYYLPNLSFHTMSTYLGAATKNAKCINLLNEQTVGAGFADGNIMIINTKNVHNELFPQHTIQGKNKRILDIQPYALNTILVGGDGGLSKIFSNKTREAFNYSAVKGIFIQPDKTLIIGSYLGVKTMRIGKAGEKNIFFGRVTCVAGLGKKYYWGTQHGVYAFSNDSVYSLTQQYPALAGVINHLDIGPDSALWVSSQQGIAILKDSAITIIRKEQGILSNICKHVSFDKNTAWISTNKGISRIDYRRNGALLQYSISNITEEDGLMANDVNQTCTGGNYVWAATSGGISFFSKDYTSYSTLHPFINITRITAGEQILPVTDTLVLDHTKNKLRIELSGISYRSGKQIQYEYRLGKPDSQWSTLLNNAVEFSALPFGYSVFEVRAVDRWGEKSDSPKKIVIIRYPPFWKSTAFAWFTYIFITVLVGTGFYTVYRKQHEKRERDYKLKKKMHDLEMKALQAQMNPHFIFNCLTSIQYHIMRADTGNANTYLHKFSTLIRQTLQYSTASTILLREEIKILTLYLELEKLRLGKRMYYEITIADDLKPDDLLIPSMIIQPYVENSVKHGVSPLQDRTGVILVKIEQAGDYIECFIEDNGPGIYSSGRNDLASSQDHISMGTNITASRIKTINAIQRDKILLEVIDKKRSGQQASGTIVHISFPILTD